MHSCKTTWTICQSSDSLRSHLSLFYHSWVGSVWLGRWIWEQTFLGKHFWAWSLWWYSKFKLYPPKWICSVVSWSTRGGDCILVPCRVWGFSLLALISRNCSFYLHAYLIDNFKFACSFSHCTFFSFVLFLTRNRNKNINNNNTPFWMLQCFEISSTKQFTSLHFNSSLAQSFWMQEEHIQSLCQNILWMSMDPVFKV